MVFTYFQILAFVSTVSRLTTQKHIFIHQKLYKVKKNCFLGSNFNKFIGKSSKIRSEKKEILLQIFFRMKNSFHMFFLASES